MGIVPRYPDIHVKLVDQDGEGFAILARCREAMGKAELPIAEVNKFLADGTAGHYDDLLGAVMRWFETS